MLGQFLRLVDQCEAKDELFNMALSSVEPKVFRLCCERAKIGCATASRCGCSRTLCLADSLVSDDNDNDNGLLYSHSFVKTYTSR